MFGYTKNWFSHTKWLTIIYNLIHNWKRLISEVKNDKLVGY